MFYLLFGLVAVWFVLTPLVMHETYVHEDKYPLTEGGKKL